MWKEYKKKWLNEEYKWSGELNVKKNEEPCERVSEKAVVEALNLMKDGKEAGPTEVTSELLKSVKMR